jgi:hypothetical protein
MGHTMDHTTAHTLNMFCTVLAEQAPKTAAGQQLYTVLYVETDQLGSSAQ